MALTDKLTLTEAVELLDLRVSAMESTMVEMFDGFHYDLVHYVTTKITPNMSETSKEKIIAEFDKIKTKYRPRGSK